MRWLLNLFGNTSNVEALEDASNAFNIEEIEEEENQEKSDNKEGDCYFKTGKITNITEKEIIIDDNYTFPYDSDFEINQLVSYITYFEDDLEKVANLKIIQDDWSITESNKQATWCFKTLIVQLIKRECRVLYVNPGNLQLNLNNVKTEFIPIEGDWLQIEAKCILDETERDLNKKVVEVVKINPLRPKIIEGVVKKWNQFDGEGQINSNIFFNRESLCMGFSPKIGDKVITEIIESEQDRCNWRSIKIIPNSHGNFGLINKFKTQREIEDDNIEIDDEVSIDFCYLNEEKSFRFRIKNKKDVDVILSGVETQNLGGFIKIEYPNEFPLTIKKDEEIFLIGSLRINTAGNSRESITFRFEDTIYVRTLNTTLLKNDYHPRQRNNFNKQELLFKARNFREIDGNYIRASRSNTTKRFIPIKIPPYNIPEKLWNILLQNKPKEEIIDDLKKNKHVLNEPLAFQFYEDRFHTLLYLEEIAELIAIRKYDRDQTPFIKNGEFLMLEIENLIEQRPSIMVGDTIIIKDSYNANSTSFEGIVEKVGAKHLYLKFHDSFHNSYNGEDYSIQVKPARMKLKRLHHAVSLAVRNLAREILFPTKIIVKSPQINFIEPNRLIQNEKNDLQLKLEWFNQKLNDHQKIAVRNILHGVCRPMPYIIFGPPGTGKTITLVEVILQTLRMIPHSRILIATPSNSAANLITTRLIESGVVNPGDLVRLVAYKCLVDGTIPQHLAPFCAVVSNKQNNVESVTTNGLVLGVDFSTIGRHRVTISTCNTFGALFQQKFDKGHFTHIMIDEAGQATEPEIMIPMSFLDLHNGQCVLAGDPQQLGPQTNSDISKEFGLDDSYLDRLISRFPYIRDTIGFPETGGYDQRFVTKLLNNYRSLPGILNVPNKLFYHSELIPTINTTNSPQIELLNKLKPILPKSIKTDLFPFIFHGVNGINLQMNDCPSWYNPDEVSQVFFYINQLYSCNVPYTDIGVITPYIKQVKEIRSVLIQADFDVPKIGTVEEFQGQEFPIIILSTVRSNQDMISTDVKHHIGFVGQAKRMNVALTRAKALLVIIGNPHLLMQDVSWREVISYAIENKAYIGCQLP
ncbi:probable RNA helicase armi [Onthophagus taurus]|uniref:probable RNA helicase armi n=1 Tax=Onthophagus taurus TaxID=166361 RepID=UPI0039BE721E